MNKGKVRMPICTVVNKHGVYMHLERSIDIAFYDGKIQMISSVRRKLSFSCPYLKFPLLGAMAFKCVPWSIAG